MVEFAQFNADVEHQAFSVVASDFVSSEELKKKKNEVHKAVSYCMFSVSVHFNNCLIQMMLFCSLVPADVCVCVCF